MKRLLLLLVVVGVIAYLVKSYGVFSPANTAAPDTGPIGRARTAAAANNARVDAASTVGRESDSSSGGAGVTENMTPDQVRALIGPPDDVQTETTDAGVRRETWTYRSVGKTVVFENGVAVSVR